MTGAVSLVRAGVPRARTSGPFVPTQAASEMEGDAGSGEHCSSENRGRVIGPYGSWDFRVRGVGFRFAPVVEWGGWTLSQWFGKIFSTRLRNDCKGSEGSFFFRIFSGQGEK